MIPKELIIDITEEEYDELYHIWWDDNLWYLVLKYNFRLLFQQIGSTEQK